MYHISRDKRAEQSAELIYRGLLECIKRKPFDLVTISDLQRESGVARTTFYRAFDNLSDVLYWKCDLCFAEVLGGFEARDFQDESRLFLQYFGYWMEHSDILELLIKIKRQDIIYACHMNNANNLKKSYGTLPGLSKAESEYFMALRTGVTVSILKAWLDSGRRETAKELVDIIKKQITLLHGSLM